MVVYFPKNGKGAQVNGFPIGRAGLPREFPIDIFERAVKMGVLVKTPQEMAPLSKEDMQKEIDKAREAQQPIFTQQPSSEVPEYIRQMEANMPKAEPQHFEGSGDTSYYDRQFEQALAAKVAARGETAPVVEQVKEEPQALKDFKPENEFDAALKAALEQKLAEKKATEEAVAVQPVVEEVVAEDSNILTYEKAISYVKTNEDGSLKVGLDGNYVLTLGKKPYSKEEICKVIKEHKA